MKNFVAGAAAATIALSIGFFFLWTADQARIQQLRDPNSKYMQLARLHDIVLREGDTYIPYHKRFSLRFDNLEDRGSGTVVHATVMNDSAVQSVVFSDESPELTLENPIGTIHIVSCSAMISIENPSGIALFMLGVNDAKPECPNLEG